jgi:hypothetical protein
MCEKCVDIDKRIERFKRAAARFNDQKMVEGLTATVARLEQEKANLHPNRNEAASVGGLSMIPHECSQLP